MNTTVTSSSELDISATLNREYISDAVNGASGYSGVSGGMILGVSYLLVVPGDSPSISFLSSRIFRRITLYLSKIGSLYHKDTR